MASPNSTTTQDTGVRPQDLGGAAQEGLADAMRRGSDAVEGARDAIAELDFALRQAIKERPYTALAVAGVVGFLYAVARR